MFYCIGLLTVGSICYFGYQGWKAIKNNDSYEKSFKVFSKPFVLTINEEGVGITRDEK